MNKRQTVKRVSLPVAEYSFVFDGTFTSTTSEVSLPTKSLYDVSVDRHLLADEHQVCFYNGHCYCYYCTQSVVSYCAFKK